jgi:hypothetical protein
VLSEFLFVWGELGGSATARVIMQTLGAMAFPFLDSLGICIFQLS